jgi:uncharacterized integral membrane protein
MKRENWMMIFGMCMAISLLCGLFLLLAAQPTVAASAETSIALADAPLVVKMLVGLAALVSGALLLAPVFRAQLTTLH